MCLDCCLVGWCLEGWFMGGNMVQPAPLACWDPSARVAHITTQESALNNMEGEEEGGSDRGTAFQSGAA